MLMEFNSHISLSWHIAQMISPQVLDNGSILSEPGCYHQFCRLLAKLKCNYQLNEIVDIEGYESIIDTIAKFTVSSLEVSLHLYFIQCTLSGNTTLLCVHLARR